MTYQMFYLNVNNSLFSTSTSSITHSRQLNTYSSVSIHLPVLVSHRRQVLSYTINDKIIPCMHKCGITHIQLTPQSYGDKYYIAWLLCSCYKYMWNMNSNKCIPPSPYKHNRFSTIEPVAIMDAS